MFIAGEAGVGKTRLANEAAARAAAGGARVLTGECLALAEGELPFAPLVAALRPLAPRASPRRAGVDPGPRGARPAAAGARRHDRAAVRRRLGASGADRPIPPVRRDAAPALASRRAGARRPAAGGPPLGGSLHPRLHLLPDPKRAWRPPPGGVHLPQRRAPPPPPAAPVPRRGGAARAGRADRAGPAHARRARRARCRHPRRASVRCPGRRPSPPLRRQPLLRRGAARGVEHGRGGPGHATGRDHGPDRGPVSSRAADAAGRGGGRPACRLPPVRGRHRPERRRRAGRGAARVRRRGTC